MEELKPEYVPLYDDGKTPAVEFVVEFVDGSDVDVGVADVLDTVEFVVELVDGSDVDVGVTDVLDAMVVLVAFAVVELSVPVVFDGNL